jgi:hypothetical protein
MSETAKNARTNKTANDTDDSKSLYELAMSCTGEYGALFIDDATTDAANIMAQMVITMTQMVFMKEN